MWPLHRHQAVGHNIRRSGVLSVQRRILRLEGATPTCILFIIMHHLRRVQNAEKESGSMKLWVEGGGKGKGKGRRCRFQ